MSNLVQHMAEFKRKQEFLGKGPLCVALVITRQAMSKVFPLIEGDFLAEKKGQVKGLGKAAVQKILADYNVKRVLAEEGGRTSRGSIENMRIYVSFLNGLNASGELDLNYIERWWVSQVIEFFSAQPFTIKMDPAKSLRAIIKSLIDQAVKRQKESLGTMYVGALMQHLVGAKLDLILGNDVVKHFGFSVSDDASGRAADFVVADSAIHVTASPGEALLRKCQRNIDSGLRPIIVTSVKGIDVADGIAEQFQLEERIDLIEIEQFLATNVYEKSKFKISNRPTTINAILERYNQIVTTCETDASLKVILE